MNLAFLPPAVAPRAATSRAVRAGDRYVVWLGLVLLGYAVLSRSFAYLGIPPLFIGEATLVLGLAVALRAGRLAPLAGQPTVWWMVALLALAAARTVPYVATYGLDAVRDAMQIGYGLYAFVIGSLLVARPERLAGLVSLYRRFVGAVLGAVWVVYLIAKAAGDGLPRLPWAAHVAILEAKGGDIMVHLAGITLFLVLGLGRRSALVMLALAANVGLVAVSNRGGMVAFAGGCALAWLLRPPQARAGRLVYAFAVCLVLGLAAGPVMTIHGGGRTISVEQIWLNVKSIVGQGGQHLDGTKAWRLEWWTQIYDYTVRGEHFWTGKGFGVNLARDDGFAVVEELRSPHNGHMTLLARMGVPGAALWVALNLAWGLALRRQWARARAAGRHRWMAVFAWLAGYTLAAHLNAAFDVYFEGPMGGIWFWTLFGTGIAAVWIHAHHPEALADGADPLDPGRPAAPAPVPWSWHAPRPAGAPVPHPTLG